jgi:hypothetical protein
MRTLENRGAAPKGVFNPLRGSAAPKGVFNLFTQVN